MSPISNLNFQLAQVFFYSEYSTLEYKIGCFWCGRMYVCSVYKFSILVTASSLTEYRVHKSTITCIIHIESMTQPFIDESV